MEDVLGKTFERKGELGRVEFDFRSLAFETGSESSQYWRSMGVAVIFGLAFATFLTLVVVPVLYDFLLGHYERRGTRNTG